MIRSFSNVLNFSFAFRNPISYDSIESRILIIDVSLALPWPCKPRVFVPFVGTIRYSSVRVHRGREQVIIFQLELIYYIFNHEMNLISK